MAWWQDFHFLRPWWLIGLIIPLAVYVIAYRQAVAQSAWRKVCDENLLKFLLVKNEKLKKTKLSSLVPALISLFLVLALSGPTWIKKENPALSVENPVMILLNMSGEMWNKDVSPSRIERAKYVIKDLTKSLRNTESGLIVYSKEPFMITPLAEDVSIIDNMLPALQMNVMPEDGDRLDRAIDFAVSRMREADVPSGNLIVVTSNVGERFDAALTAAAKAAEQGFDVNIINVSSKAVEKLEMVAEKGRGMLLNYNQSYAPLVKKINDITSKEIKQSKNLQTVWEDMGWYLLWFPALLLLGCFRKGALAALLLSLLTGVNAQAGWFLNDNQEALQEFKKQNYAAAAEKFTDTQWKAAAEYKNGNYQKAYEKYAQKNDAVSLYNQGNALAKGGKIAEAIKKYEEALQKQSDFPDAKFNLEYLKKQQQQQNQQHQQQDKNKQDKKEQQQQKQQAQNNSEQQQADEKQKQNPQQEQKESENQQKQQNQSGQQEKQKPQQSKSDSSEQQQADKQQTDENENKAQQAEKKQNNNESRQSENSKLSDNKSDRENTAEIQQQTAENKEGNEQQETVGVNDEKSPEELEKMRARMQKFRQIPEDKGGLLRALIQREYAKRRYDK